MTIEHPFGSVHERTGRIYNRRNRLHHVRYGRIVFVMAWGHDVVLEKSHKGDPRPPPTKTILVRTHRFGDEDDTFPFDPDQLQELIHVFPAIFLWSTGHGNLRASAVGQAGGVEGIRCSPHEFRHVVIEWSVMAAR